MRKYLAPIVVLAILVLLVLACVVVAYANDVIPDIHTDTIANGMMWVFGGIGGAFMTVFGLMYGHSHPPCVSVELCNERSGNFDAALSREEERSLRFEVLMADSATAIDNNHKEIVAMIKGLK